MARAEREQPADKRRHAKPDGVAGVAADWTAANSYDFYVLTPSSVYRFGDFFGHTAEINFNAEEEEAELKRGVPRKLIAKALLERTLSIAGVNYNVPNGDVLKTIMQMDPRGISVGETEYQTGFDPSAKANYRVALLGETYESKPFTILAYKGLFKLGGGLNLSEEGFKSVPYEFGLLSDSIRSSAYDAFSIFIGD